jgi:hypothetical protein
MASWQGQKENPLVISLLPQLVGSVPSAALPAQKSRNKHQGVALKERC